MSSTYLKIENLTKRYRRLTAVNALSFSLEKGNVYGILGPNGSGKSTTLGMILHVINPTSGSFEWFDGSLPPKEALKKIGAIIEHPNFYPYMTAVQNLELVCKIKQIPNTKIDEKLDQVGLLARKNDKFKTYSLGMKQRLAIASALLNDPKVLILDEPTNGLDPQGIHQIREIIKTIAKRGTTILMASHLLDEVEKICSHVLVIRKGEKLYEGRVDALDVNFGYMELKSSGQTKNLIDFLQNYEGIGTLKKDPLTGIIVVQLTKDISAEKLNRDLFENQIVLSHLLKRKESLEKRFLRLTNSQNL